MTRLESLGRDVADEQDDALARRGSLDESRARWQQWIASGAAPRRRAAPHWPWVGAGAAAVAAAFAVWHAARPTPRPPLAYAVEGAGTPAPGAWVAAPDDAEARVRFSDDTSIVLAPRARARIAELGPDGARVVLERGEANFHVTHTPTSAWRVEVGPFEVRVTGTRFGVRWEPETDSFSLALTEGSVTVKGDCLAAERPLRAGESLRAICHAEGQGAAGGTATGRVEVRGPDGSAEGDKGAKPAGSASEGTTTTGAASGTPSSTASGAAGGATSVTAGGATSAGSGGSSSTSAAVVPSGERASLGAAEPSVRPPAAAGAVGTTRAAVAPKGATAEVDEGAARWRALVASGHYRDALVGLSEASFAVECERASAADLLMLGDAARFAGELGRSERAYVALRRRFVGDARAPVAAFSLGKLAFDGRGAYAEAARWFGVYLAEQPNGDLAREALGRSLEAESRLGDRSSARALARRYLDRFPSGPHRALAESMAAP